jgi:hypothetical protein
MRRRYILILILIFLFLVLCWRYRNSGIFGYLNGISTIVIAFFAGVSGWIAYRQYKMYNDPELRVTQPKISKWKYRSQKDGVWDIEIVLINPGTVPIEVDRISEYISREKADKELPVQFIPPPENRPEGIFITQLPWIIKKGHFAISRRRIYTPDIEEPIKIVIQYFVNKPKRITVVSPPLKNYRKLPPLSEKRIVDMLKEVQKDLFKKLSLFENIQEEDYKNKLLECLIKIQAKIIYICDELQEDLKAGYHARLSKLIGFVKKAIRYLRDFENKWAEFGIVIRQFKNELDNIIKEWSRNISLSI